MSRTSDQNAEAISDVANRVRDKATEVSDQLKGAATDKFNEVRDRASDKFNEVRDRASDAYNQGRETAEQWEQSLETYIQEKPLQAVLLAAGAGLLLGLIWKRS